ncbi:MAG: hypothetical protein AABX03_05015 [Nanoarchaeota archaeon]
MKTDIKCSYCKSLEVVKRGFFQTETHGKQQRYYCKSCNRKFIEQTPFYRMRNNPQKITCALDLFYRGLSTRDVQHHFKAFFPHNSDHSTILRWIWKYNQKIANFTDNLQINTGSYIEVDECEFHRRKSHKRKGIDKNWLINAIDVKNRFLICSNYAKHRSQNEIKNVLSIVKSKTNKVKIIQTDGLMAYDKVVKSSWGYDNKLRKYKVEHKVKTQSKNEGFNIWVERLHNSIRQRTQNFRGFHGSVSSAHNLMKGYEIYYNFIRKHEALKGKTPSDLATDLKFESENRWLELINLSSNPI